MENFSSYFKDISTFPIIPREFDNAYEYLTENRIALIGTPDDAIEYIETLLEGSGGFGGSAISPQLGRLGSNEAELRVDRTVRHAAFPEVEPRPGLQLQLQPGQ